MYSSIDTPPSGIPDPTAQPNPFGQGKGFGNALDLYRTIMANRKQQTPGQQLNNPFSAPQSGKVTNPDLNNYVADSFIRRLLWKYF